MPRHRPPGCLKEQCVHNIALNMDTFWCQDYVKNWLGKIKTLFVLGPFEDLPSPLIEMIIEELIRIGKLRKHHLDLLLLYHLERLNLRNENSDFGKIISLLAERCTKLRHLSLKSKSLPRKILNEMFISLERLQTVNLSDSNISNQTLSVIAAYCKHIRVLNLANTGVTDIGVSSLCHGIKTSEIKQSEKTHISRSLVRLDLYGTAVTTTGIQCALNYMPNLKEIVHSSLLYSLSKMEESRRRMAEEALILGSNCPDFSPLQLKMVQSDEFGGGAFGGVADAQHIASAVKLCPSIQYLYLRDISNIKSCSLLPILDLKNVIDLVLTVDGSEDVGFYEDIVPLLQYHGESLRHLHLQNIQKININIISILCPELHTLELDGNNTYCHIDQWTQLCKYKSVEPKFNHLRSVLLQHVPNDIFEPLSYHIPAECLRLVLGSPMLEKIDLMGQELLSDEILIDEIHTTKFPHLKSMSFTLCNNITSESIWGLVQLNNPLSELSLIDCHEITIRDFDALQKYVKKNKLELNISWA